MNWLGHETPAEDLDALCQLAARLNDAHWEGFKKGTDEASRRTIAVEIGCWTGQSTIVLAEEFDTVFAVDHWYGSPEMPQRERGELFGAFCVNLGDWLLESVFPLVGPSALWAAVFNRKADLIFIDALHDYENVKDDIAAWWPHVRAGGILCGHDFHLEGVRKAVEEFGYDGQIANVWYKCKEFA